MANNVSETIAKNRAALVQAVVNSLNELESHPRLGAKLFRDAWNGVPLADQDQLRYAQGGVHAACLLSAGYVLADGVLHRDASNMVLKNAGFISSVLNGDMAGVLQYLGLHEDTDLGEGWEEMPSNLIKDAMNEYSSIAYVFADDDEERIRFFISSFCRDLYLAGCDKKFPHTFKALTDEDYRQHVKYRQEWEAAAPAREAEIKRLQEQEAATQAAEQDQPQPIEKENTMTEQVKDQSEAVVSAVETAAAQAAVATVMDSYIDQAKAASNSEAVECLAFFKDVATRSVGLNEKATATLAVAMAEAELAKHQAAGKPVPTWLTVTLKEAKAQANGQDASEPTTEVGFESLLSKITVGTSKEAKERVRPLLAEHVKAHLPEGEPAPAFLDKAIEEGAQVIEQQAARAAKAAAADGVSEASAIAAQRIMLTEDRAKLRAAIAEIPTYNPTGNEMVAHNTEVVRNFYISSGGGGSSRASEPLFSDEFVETCGNIAKVALGTAVVVGVGYVAFKGAQALYDWATE